jgi:hypothetical protein
MKEEDIWQVTDIKTQECFGSMTEVSEMKEHYAINFFKIYIGCLVFLRY